MKRISTCVVFLLALAATAPAATIFQSFLTGPNEVPPNASPATGTGVFTLSDDESTLSVNLSFSGLSSTDTAAHIHCCIGPGSNAPVALNFTGFGFPTGVTSGTYSHTFTLATDLSGITPANFVSALFAGTTYVNVHTTNFPGGEIRDQLNQIPEASTWGLMALGLGACAVGRRMRQRA